VGDTVEEGDVVAQSGVTGNASGLAGTPDLQHLHLVVRNPDGDLIDPEAWLNDEGDEGE
jgi:murein DD-endopeptidase MepM/ murein hydrolase activator NlpD